MVRIVVTVVLLFPVLASAQNPGLKARITTKGLDSVNKFVIQAVETNVKKATIQDVSGSAAGIYYQAKNLQVTQFIPPTSDILLIPGSGINWKFSNAQITVHGDFSYQKWFISGGCTFDVKVSGVSSDTDIYVGVDFNGKPSISATKCQSNIGNIDVTFQGGMAWLYNLFSGIVADNIKNSFNNEISKMIVTKINEFAENLAKLETTITLAKKFVLDYRLVQAPVFQSQYLETAHKGEIYWAADPTTESPFTPSPMSDNTDTSSMLYLFVSDYVLDTFGYSAQHHGFLRYSMTQQDLPEASRWILNTTCENFCVGKLIPQIGVKYPNMAAKLRVESTEVPAVSINKDGLNISVAGLVDMYAMKPGLSDTPFLISLFTTVQTSVSVWTQNERIYAKIDTWKLNLRVVKSEVGDVPDKLLKVLVDKAMTAYLIPRLNDLGKKGFPLPMTKDITFQNTQLLFAQDTMILSTDVTYTPSTEDELDQLLNFQPSVRDQNF